MKVDGCLRTQNILKLLMWSKELYSQMGYPIQPKKMP